MCGTMQRFMNDQPMSAQNTLQRHHMSSDLRMPHRWSERLSALTTSDNDMNTTNYGYGGYGGYNTGSPGSHSELSSEDKYVAMSPPNLLHQTYQQYSTSYTTSDPSQQYSSDPTSLIPSDITQESHHIS